MEKMQSKTVYRRLFLLLVLVAGLYFLYRVRVILIPFIFASFIAYLLNPAVRFVENKKVPRNAAILVVYLVVFCLLASLTVLGVPHIMEELNKLGRAIPELMEEVQGLITDAEKRYARFVLPEGIKQVIDERITDLGTTLTDVVRGVTDTLIGVFSYLPGLIIAPLFAFYMLKDTENIKEAFTLTVPRRYRSDVTAIGRDIDEIISAFLRGHLVISFIVGILTGMGMYIVGLEFSFIIGLIAGIAELVPYLGPLITAVPAVALALLHSKKTALYAVVVILIVQQLENAVISPRILGKSMGLHPLMIIFALLAGAELLGFTGVILAVPGAAAIKVVLRYIYLKLVDEK